MLTAMVSKFGASMAGDPTQQSLTTL
jgi:hypothetical protein